MFPYLVQTVFQIVWNKKYFTMYCKNTISSLYYCLYAKDKPLLYSAGLPSDFLQVQYSVWTPFLPAAPPAAIQLDLHQLYCKTHRKPFSTSTFISWLVKTLLKSSHQPRDDYLNHSFICFLCIRIYKSHNSSCSVDLLIWNVDKDKQVKYYLYTTTVYMNAQKYHFSDPLLCVIFCWRTHKFPASASYISK